MLPTLFLHLIAGTISIPTVVDGYHHHGSNRIAFQLSRAHHRKSAKPSMIRASDVSAEADWNNDALRHTIDKLVSIIGPDDSSKTAQSMSSLASSASTTQSSIVHIIGTGLYPTLLNLPLSTLHILSQADVVLYDSLGLSYQDIIQIVPKHCEVICVGKRGDKKSWKQTDIDDLILQMATVHSDKNDDDMQQQMKGKKIVRLKGGDPFLFGRTRTEIDALRNNNIPYTYTPSISSCIAGPHLGGIPLTDPSLDCQSFGVWSGTDAFGKSWGDTNAGGKQFQGVGVDVLVFLMIGRLDKLEGLAKSIANGGGVDDDVGKWNKDTPCAVIQNAGGIKDTNEPLSSLPKQKVWRSTLEHIVSTIKEEDETITSVSPAVFVVGKTAALDLLSQQEGPQQIPT